MTAAAEKRKKRNDKIQKFLDNQKNGFEPEPVKRDYESLDTLDKTLIQLLLENPGIKIPELASQCKTSYQRVYERTHKEDFKEILKKYSEESLNILLDARIEASKKIVKIMNEGKDQDALNASKIILYGTSTIFDKRFQDISIKNQSVNVVYTMPSGFMPTFSKEQIQELKNTGKIEGDSDIEINDNSNITEIGTDENPEPEPEIIEPKLNRKKKKTKITKYRDFEVEEDDDEDF